MENIQIVSLNARGLQNKNKRNIIFQYFKTKKFDVILLQETYSTLPRQKRMEKGMGRPRLFLFPQQPQMWSSDTLYEQQKQIKGNIQKFV